MLAYPFFGRYQQGFLADLVKQKKLLVAFGNLKRVGRQIERAKEFHRHENRQYPAANLKGFCILAVEI